MVRPSALVKVCKSVEDEGDADGESEGAGGGGGGAASCPTAGRKPRPNAKMAKATKVHLRPGILHKLATGADVGVNDRIGLMLSPN